MQSNQPEVNTMQNEVPSFAGYSTQEARRELSAQPPQEPQPPVDQVARSVTRAYESVERLESVVTQIIDGVGTGTETGIKPGVDFASVMSGLRQMPECVDSLAKRLDEQTDRLRQALLEP